MNKYRLQILLLAPGSNPGSYTSALIGYSRVLGFIFLLGAFSLHTNCGLASNPSSDIVPADRLYDWGAYCGVPGGIPNRTTIFRTLTPSNTTAEINAAIAACPSGQVVYLAAGEYNIGQIVLGRKSNVTLRGAGAGHTIINTTASQAIVSDSYSFFNEDHIDIANGSWLQKGSSSITLASSPSAAFSVGNLIMITQDDSTNLWGTGIGVYHRQGLSDPWPLGGTRCLRFVTRITAVNGNTISLASPLPVSFLYSLNPHAMPLRSGPPISLFGIENLTINGSGGADGAVSISGADRCWVKNVEVRNTTGTIGAVFLANASQCEVNRCYVHDTPGYPTQSDGFGVMLYYGASGTLVVDSIFNRTGVSIIMNGAVCNALVNNYVGATGGGNGTWQVSGINCNHGPQGIMNLFEGNYINRFQNDGYHGSTSHGTLFRNYIHGVDPDGKMLERQLVDLCRGSYYHNVVGNILGDSSWNPNYYEAVGSADHTLGYVYVLGWGAPDSVNPSADATIWTGWTGPIPDTNVKATLIRHGNYDYYNKGVVWDSNISSRTIPNSLIYSSKPGYFGTLQWPPIGPDVAGLVMPIPAKARWDAYLSSGRLDDLFKE